MMSVLARRSGQLRRDGARTFDRRHPRARRPDRQGAARFAADRRRGQGVQRCSRRSARAVSRRPTGRCLEIFAVNAKHPARLDEDTATEVRRLLREEWLRGQGAGTRHRGAARAADCTWTRKQTPPSLADFLASVETCSPRSRGTKLDRLAEDAQSRFFAFGDTVCNAGEPADGLFVIKSGSIRVFTEEHGKEISMGVRKARRRLRRDRHAARLPARVVGARVGKDRAAVHPAQHRRADRCRATPQRARSSPARVAISSAGGFDQPVCSTCAARSTRASSRNSSAASA